MLLACCADLAPLWPISFLHPAPLVPVQTVGTDGQVVWSGPVFLKGRYWSLGVTGGAYVWDNCHTSAAPCCSSLPGKPAGLPSSVCLIRAWLPWSALHGLLHPAPLWFLLHVYRRHARAQASITGDTMETCATCKLLTHHCFFSPHVRRLHAHAHVPGHLAQQL